MWYDGPPNPILIAKARYSSPSPEAFGSKPREQRSPRAAKPWAPRDGGMTSQQRPGLREFTVKGFRECRVKGFREFRVRGLREFRVGEFGVYASQQTITRGRV